MSVKLFESSNLGVSLTSIVCDDGNVYFKVRDVAEFLGYENTRDAIGRHVWEEDRLELRSLPTFDEGGGLAASLQGTQPQTVFITELGLYQLIFGSELESAKNFKR